MLGRSENSLRSDKVLIRNNAFQGIEEEEILRKTGNKMCQSICKGNMGTD